MKKLLLILIPVFLIVFTGLILKSKIKKEVKEIHYHAGFLVYADGKLQDFSDSKYMHVEPCGIPGKEKHEDDQIEKAHLHDGVGDIVHVHRKGAVWGDLFRNIKYQISNNTNIEGFLKGEKISNILTYPINPYDSVIITIGEVGNTELNHYVEMEHLQEVESKSETC